ncbi:hypothetical protein [Mycobacterium canetti]|nr:hypothetical protein [Mycobacterium canetti]
MRASPGERVDGAYAGAGPHTQAVLEEHQRQRAPAGAEAEGPGRTG